MSVTIEINGRQLGLLCELIGEALSDAEGDDLDPDLRHWRAIASAFDDAVDRDVKEVRLHE